MKNKKYTEILDLFSSWLNNNVCYSKNAKTNYISITKNLLHYFESFNITQLDDASLDLLSKFIAFREGRAYAPTFVRVRISALSLFYKWAYKQGYCKKNLIIEYRKNQLKDKASLDNKKEIPLVPKDLLSVDEQNTLLNIKTNQNPLTVRNKCMALLILAGALFAEEVVWLPKSGLNLDDGYVDVNEENNRARRVKLDLELCKDICTKWLSVRDGFLNGISCQQLFVTKKGTPLTKRMLYKIITQFLIGAGIKKKRLGPEVLRQTAICNMVRQGFTLEEIQANTGLTTVGNIAKYKLVVTDVK